MKEEKEQQKKKEEQLNLKESKEKKAVKKTAKEKEETTGSKEIKKTVKKAPAKKDSTKEVKAKKTTSKTKSKAEKEDNKEDVAEVKVEKKTTKKATPKTTKTKTEGSKKKTSKTTAKKKSTVSTKKTAKADAKEENKEDSNIEINEEKANVEVSIADNTEKEEKAKVVSTKESEKTKANNAKLEANIAKLKGIKVQKTKITKTDDTDNEEIIIDEPKENIEKQKKKEKIEKQAQLAKKKRKNRIIIASIVTALIIIIVLITIFIGTLNSKSIKSHNFYQWISGEKIAYTGELIFNRKEGLVELKAIDKDVTLDSTPVYYADEKNKVIFPKNMAIVYPTNNGVTYRINQCSNIVAENGETYLETTNKTRLEQAFLYDGQDLYFFLERTKIIVNGTIYEVSPLSYVKVNYKQNVEIYNYQKDEYQIIDTTEVQDATVEGDTYTINMSVDSIQTAEKEQLLIRGLSYLQPIEEVIKK